MDHPVTLGGLVIVHRLAWSGHQLWGRWCLIPSRWQVTWGTYLAWRDPFTLYRAQCTLYRGTVFTIQGIQCTVHCLVDWVWQPGLHNSVGRRSTSPGSLSHRLDIHPSYWGHQTPKAFEHSSAFMSLGVGPQSFIA